MWGKNNEDYLIIVITSQKYLRNIQKIKIHGWQKNIELNTFS